jgi:hypothetical protein
VHVRDAKRREAGMLTVTSPAGQTSITEIKSGRLGIRLEPAEQEHPGSHLRSGFFACSLRS